MVGITNRVIIVINKKKSELEVQRVTEVTNHNTFFLKHVLNEKLNTEATFACACRCPKITLNEGKSIRLSFRMA